MNAHQLLEKADELSRYAASIHWCGRRNTKEWMSGLRELIAEFQSEYAKYLESLHAPTPPKGGSGASNCRGVSAWSIEPPTEPGWYWAVYPAEETKPALVEIYRSAGDLLIKDWPSYGVCAVEELCQTKRGPFGKIKWLKIPEPELPPKE